MENIHSFLGGTLIEYLDGARFSREFSRARIISITEPSQLKTIDGEECMITSLLIETDGKAKLGTSSLTDWEKREINGITYMIPPGWARVVGSAYYAIAPEGIEIPEPGKTVTTVVITTSKRGRRGRRPRAA